MIETDECCHGGLSASDAISIFMQTAIKENQEASGAGGATSHRLRRWPTASSAIVVEFGDILGVPPTERKQI
jgi:hypothetical protein